MSNKPRTCLLTWNFWNKIFIFRYQLNLMVPQISYTNISGQLLFSVVIFHYHWFQKSDGWSNEDQSIVSGSILLWEFLSQGECHAHVLMVLSFCSMQSSALLVKSGSTSLNHSISKEVLVPDVPTLITLQQ